jgi:uncharacterized protein (UPF0335 family)
VLKEFRENAEMDASESKKRLDELTKAISRKEQERQRLISMTIKGVLPEEDARPFMAKIIDELTSLRKELASHNATQGFDFDVHAASTEDFRKDVEGILELGNTEAYAGMIDTMVNKVILYPDHVHIEFEWDPTLINKTLEGQ